MKVHVFAALKDVMPAALELNATDIRTIRELKETLLLTYPDAVTLLNACRFSSEKEILPLEKEITDYENIFVIPPSSGG
ncbi:MoaD/ThiS family protein [Cytophaga hutchinsonii]|jgi:molybdopterin converting factor small subunit|uniref:Molybdopterin synthase subunit MoaD n=1 Tax=Cytophaga hutchinsonii (strain ATCC 33406 / DSM 1761 / CIP 103989 / NBRC 15051 / NCIMB 9469 / D465) TaxID=269798 RepID=A0A6N4SQM7_CYTH3|nr:MoaD/ThiS family protein [Cytophaga hutchinsonii]ABG58595.1 hypothetical protein CHU_1323 [Cytophaga hutchinsonii ATCC 33406]SFX77853.1 molybdopterin synthase sulfur carrier subunit [Cytophaga hutchinsonii ATCC 33406]